MHVSMLEITILGEPDITEAATLVKSAFDQCVAPLYSDEGIRGFYRYIQPQDFASRLHHQHILLGAKLGQDIVGVIELRHSEHISLLFVAPERQHQGIATLLFAKAVAVCRQQSPALSSISVNSSPNAVSIYERLGFVADTEEQEVHGLRFTPMTFDLKESSLI